MAANIDPHIRADLMLRAWRLKGRGLPQAEIAAELSTVYPDVRVGQSTVSRWINAQSRRTLARLDDEAAFELVSGLYKLRGMDTELEAAWERSKTSRKEASASQGAAGSEGKAGGKTTRIKTVDRDGDPAFIRERRETIDQIFRLLRVAERFAPPPADDRSDDARTLADALAEAEAEDATYDAPPAPETAADATDHQP